MDLLATQMAAAVRTGELTACQAAEAALDRIDATQPEFNAWQVIRRGAALAEADAVDARPDRAELPLAGVPIAIKDNVPVAGEPMRNGSAGSDPAPQRSDHVVVRGLREAAAVPIAHGNDGLGSVRIPAACCGLVGIKPGAGVVPLNPGEDNWFGMGENGVLATTVADTALMFSVLAGDPSLADPRRPRTVADRGLQQGAGHGSAGREGVGRCGTLDGRPAARRPRRAERRPVVPLRAGSGRARALARAWRPGRRPLADPTNVEKRNRRLAAMGRRIAARGYPKHRAREQWRTKSTEFFSDVDVLVTPTLAQPPIRAREWSKGGLLRTVVSNVQYAPFAAPWNHVGWPAMSVPAGLDARGLPVAVQVVGSRAPRGHCSRWLRRSRSSARGSGPQ